MPHWPAVALTEKRCSLPAPFAVPAADGCQAITLLAYLQTADQGAFDGTQLCQLISAQAAAAGIDSAQASILSITGAPPLPGVTVRLSLSYPCDQAAAAKAFNGTLDAEDSPPWLTDAYGPDSSIDPLGNE